MCVIFSCLKGKPTTEQLEGAYAGNKHGAGVAWVESGKVKWQKGLDTVAEVEELLEKLPLPCVVHFRSASAGGISPELTHPFPLSPLAETALSGETTEGVLFQNGTWSSWDTELLAVARLGRGVLKLPGGLWSDTRALAFLAGNFGQGYLSCLGAIGNSRVVTLSPKGPFHWGNWEKEWLKDQGFLASNNSFAPKVLGGKFQVLPGSAGETKKKPALLETSVVETYTRGEVQRFVEELRGYIVTQDLTVMA